ncbi:amidohydrolase family protein [Niveibacterium sp. SC-1]|uniref:amidohydrolase family protein n=1 Tax=Niveibacterium sp. SC-1 TaxID=3135646 RepID=UPI00311DD8E7
MNRIDAHQHFWRRSRGDYTWLNESGSALAPLQRDFLPMDLTTLLEAGGINRTVLVQAADTVAETEFLLDLATRHDFIAGVVGWVDLSRSDAAATIERLASNPKFKGVRPMLQDLPMADWIARAPHPDAVRTLIRLGLRFDALVKSEHLPALLRFMQAWPELAVVVDHCAKPPLGEGGASEHRTVWRRHMSEIATLPQAHCKFSGLVTEIPATQRATGVAAIDALRPVRDDVLQWFGPARLMWGSDWPVVNLAFSYPQWLALSESLLGELAPAEQAAVWAGTAQQFYGIQ